MARFTIARDKSGRSETPFAEPDVAAARIEAIRAARIASNRSATERLERALRAAEQDAAGAVFPAPKAASPADRRSAA
jgi:hypothetical protein